MKKKFDNLQPAKKKIADKKIDKVLQEIEGGQQKIKKQKQIPFNVKLPENLYHALDREAKQAGLSKKAILVNALWDKLGRGK